MSESDIDNNRKRKATSPEIPNNAEGTSHNQSATSSATQPMELIDIIRSTERVIPRILERTGPEYMCWGTPYQPCTLSIDDIPSWQHLIDNHSHSTKGPYFPGVSELWKCLERRRCLKIGQHVLLHRSDKAQNVRDMKHICEVVFANPIHLYASETAIAEASQSAATTPSALLFGKVLKALSRNIKVRPVFACSNHGLIRVKCPGSIEWITKTTDRYMDVDISGVPDMVHQLSADHARWFAHHAQQVTFKMCRFDETAAASLSQALSQDCAVLQDLELHVDSRHLVATVFRSLTTLFRQQSPCSLVTLRLHLKGRDNDGSWESLMDALAHYQGHVENIKIAIDAGSANLLTMVGWCEALMASPTLRNIDARLGLKEDTNETINEAAHRLATALKKNENIEYMRLDATGETETSSDIAREIYPIVEYRKVKKRLLKLSAALPENNGDAESLQLDRMVRGNLIVMALSDVHPLDYLAVLYATIFSHVNHFLDLWKNGCGQQRSDE